MKKMLTKRTVIAFTPCRPGNSRSKFGPATRIKYLVRSYLGVPGKKLTDTIRSFTDIESKAYIIMRDIWQSVNVK